ncbi:hypothetical protein KIH86_13530 [Paenibacillus sp. HN-1]|uniref:dTMP kinase n=1 Tax=Paenibacillus TaxID=44249 RepID=UPI001CA8F840|nr:MULTISPECIES: hypothetical protein [Paenibacillus]MBY9080759.1 hypothetical protein [Paenibacillus sp. CGMCC 1.18879]MBY9085249.1 hypothetical protein [Paenibacillus sinensis]
MIICIAGIDGSGKSTLVSNLYNKLAEQHTCSSMRIYDTFYTPKLQKKAASFLRQHQIGVTRHNLMIAYMMHELSEISYPRLMNARQEADIVIIDRYLETIDFIVDHYGVDPRTLQPVIHNMPKPDVYIYLRVDPAVAYERICMTREPSEGEELQAIIAASGYYDNHAQRLGLTVVNGEASEQDVLETCLQIIESFHNVLQS